MGDGWQIRNIYLYLVALVTLMMIVFGLSTFLGNVARLAFPLEYRYYVTLMDVESEYIYSGRDVPPLEDLRQMRQERMDIDAARDRAYQVRDLISSLAVWVVALPFYLYHWRKISVELLECRGESAHEA